MMRVGLILGMLSIILLSSFIPASFGLYIVSVPNTTLYADDVDSYHTTACASQAPKCLPGWGTYDNGTVSPFNTGIANISTIRSYSCCESLMIQVPAVSSFKLDRHRNANLVTNSTTQIIQFSGWFAYNNATRGTWFGTTHFALEFYETGTTNHYECVIQLNQYGGIPTPQKSGPHVTLQLTPTN